MLETEAIDHLRDAAEAAGLPDVEVVAPTQFDVRLDDMQIHVLDWGGPGEPIVLLHGGGLTAHTWDLVCLQLRPRYRCVAPDLRGHGDSSWSSSADYRLDAYRADVEGLVDYLGLERFVLVGMSLGGATAIHFAGRHAEKLSALVLVDVGPQMSGGAGRERLRNFSAQPPLPSVDAFVERAMTFNPRRKPELLRRSLLHNLRQDDNGMWVWKYDPRRMAPTGADPARRGEAMWASVERISCPTLVVKGAQSELFMASDAEALVNRLPSPEFVQIEGAGHTVQGDQPRALAEAVQAFLARVL